MIMWMLTDIFCESKGIKHEFSTPKTPQQNVVAERKNRMLQEMARVMIYIHNTPMQFWAEAINTTCCIANRIFLRLGTKKTSYELWIGRKYNLKYFWTFGMSATYSGIGRTLGSLILNLM